MADRDLKLADVLNDKVAKQAFEYKENGNKVSSKREYRTRTGDYVAHCFKTFFKMVEDGPNKGRKFMRILIKLYTDTKKYRGNTFTNVSWHFATKPDGTPDLQFKLFQQLCSTLGAPPTAELGEILEVIEDEWIHVWGKEYFNVKVEDLLPIHQSLIGNRSTGMKVYVFVETNDDDVAAAYLAKEYKSEFMVMRISELPREETPSVGGAKDDIPF